jgi:hypothetical protein
VVYKEINAAVRAQFVDSVRTFKAITTEIEVVLSGEYSVESLKRSSGAIDLYGDRSKFTHITRAFTLARKRRASLKIHLADTVRRSGSPLDAAVMREFDRARVKNIGVRAEKTATALSIRSVAELIDRADNTERAFDDALALAPHSDEVTLPPDGSGEPSPTPPIEGGGGTGSPDPPTVEPSSFDQYPPDIQVQAQDAYDRQVAPDAQKAIDSGLSDIRELLRNLGLDPDGGPSPSPNLHEAVTERVNSTLSKVNATIAGIVAGVAAGIGGALGAGLAALALLLIPIMLAAAEEKVQEALK